MSGHEADEQPAELQALVDALESIPESPLTAWYNAIRQPSEGVEEVSVSVAFGDDGIDRISINEIDDGSEIYSPWADLMLTHETAAFISKDEFIANVRQKASEKL